MTFGETSGGTFGVLSLLSWTPKSSLRSPFRAGDDGGNVWGSRYERNQYADIWGNI